MRFRMPALTALLTAGILALAGCVPAPDVVVPVEPSGTQPVFASDEEALAAAVAVYEEYASIVASISQAEGSDPEDLKSLVTPDLYEREIVGLNELDSLGIRLIGSVKYAPLLLQQHWIDELGMAHVVVYFCADTTGYQVVKDGAAPYRPEAVPDAYLVEVSFVGTAPDSSDLLVEEVGEWRDPTGCSGL